LSVTELGVPDDDIAEGPKEAKLDAIDMRTRFWEFTAEPVAGGDEDDKWSEIVDPGEEERREQLELELDPDPESQLPDELLLLWFKRSPL